MLLFRLSPELWWCRMEGLGDNLFVFFLPWSVIGFLFHILPMCPSKMVSYLGLLIIFRHLTLSSSDISGSNIFYTASYHIQAVLPVVLPYYVTMLTTRVVTIDTIPQKDHPILANTLKSVAQAKSLIFCILVCKTNPVIKAGILSSFKWCTACRNVVKLKYSV